MLSFEFVFVIVGTVMQKLVKDFYKVLNQVKTEKIPEGLKLPDSFSQLVSELKHKHYDARTFAMLLKAMVSYLLEEILFH